MRIQIALATAAALVAATPAFAVTNLINNGSFEAAGTTGTGAFNGWSKLNVPGGNGGDVPASVIVYNSTAQYPVSAYGEAVTPDNFPTSGSPDAVGNYAAYFVGDFSVNETIYQDLSLNPGNYRVGFSYYLTANGLANPGNGSLVVSILGIPVATTIINNSSTGQTWFYASGVGQIQYAGTYRTALVYNTNLGGLAKDIVVDRVFGVTTTDPADVIIPPAPDSIIPAIPEPSTWAMMLAGFGLVGFGMRRRRSGAVAA